MLNDVLKYMRKASGLKQEELAKKIGTAPSTISGYEIEHSRPKFETVEKIAEACEFEIQFVDKNSGQIVTTTMTSNSDK